MHQTSVDEFGAFADGFLDHCDSARGAVRHELVARQIAQYMPPPPALVADVGGGAGHQAFRLATAGYDVTLIDPSEAMLEQAQLRLDALRIQFRGTLTLHHSSGEAAVSAFGPASFDAVLCHGVLMYQDYSEPLVHALTRLTRSGGLVSILTKNGDALAMRAGLEGRYGDALLALRSDRDLGRLGVTTRADTLQQLADLLWEYDTRIVNWFGVRIFSDHLGDLKPGTDFGELLEAEWQAAQTDPYRQVGRLLHVIARRD